MRRKHPLFGYTLIEILAALFVILTVGAAVSSILYYSAMLEKKDQVLNESGHIGVTLLEQLDRSVNTADKFNTLSTTSYIYIPDNNSYVYKFDVESVNDNLKYISVGIFHRNLKVETPAPDTSRINGGRTVQLGTYIKRP